MAGGPPPRALGLVVEWASSRRAAIEEDWDLAQRHRPLKAIEPLGQDSAMLGVKEAVPTGGFGVRQTLTDGEVVERALDGVLWGPAFEVVRRDPSAFAALAVEAGTLAWPGGAEIDPDVLIWGGAAPADPAAG